LCVLKDLYKHKNVIPIFDHEHKTRFKQNINICLPYCIKVFGQKSTLYIGLHICVSFNINIINFKNLTTFKKYIKKLDLDCI